MLESGTPNPFFASRGMVERDVANSSSRPTRIFAPLGREKVPWHSAAHICRVCNTNDCGIAEDNRIDAAFAADFEFAASRVPHLAS